MSRRVQRRTRTRPIKLGPGLKIAIVRPRRLMGEGPARERRRGMRGVVGRTIPRVYDRLNRTAARPRTGPPRR
jgi:hypothetical protein